MNYYNDLMIIKSNLLHGEITKIARLLGIHRTTVVRALDGWSDRTDIVECAVDVINERRKKKDNAVRKMEELRKILTQ